MYNTAVRQRRPSVFGGVTSCSVTSEREVQAENREPVTHPTPCEHLSAYKAGTTPLVVRRADLLYKSAPSNCVLRTYVADSHKRSQAKMRRNSIVLLVLFCLVALATAATPKANATTAKPASTTSTPVYATLSNAVTAGAAAPQLTTLFAAVRAANVTGALTASKLLSLKHHQHQCH